MTIWSAEIKEIETLHTSIKGRFPELEKELVQLIETKDANVVLLYSRRCLEVIITDLCESELKRPRKTEPLKGIIDKLSHEEKVPSHIITSMQNLNSLSTYGAHPKEFDPRQVKPVLNNLTTIIEWYLKYKDAQVISKPTPEKVKDETKESVDSTEHIRKPKKSLILLLSGLALVVVIVVVALFVFDIIGGGKQTEDLEKSIAVLPFFNDSEDQENTYFINGIMDEVLINLQTIKDLRVVSRSSVEQYRDPNRPTSPEIARKLGVNYIVEGSGQKYGNTFRLRVQLLEGSKDRHLWGESYEQEIEGTKDVFRIQNQIAEAIANELKAIITPEEKQLIEKTTTTSLTAYDFYQRGREEYFNGNIERAENLYHEALKYDSTFAQAYTGLASVYWDKNYWGTFFSEDFLDTVLILCNTALSYDDQLSEAYYLRGAYYSQMNDRDQAIKELDKALKYNPNDWMVYSELGSFYLNYDFVKSIDNYHKAISLNRGEQLPNLLRQLGSQYENSGFVEKGKYYFLEAYKLDRDSLSYYKGLWGCEFHHGNFERALELRKKIYAIDSNNMINLFALGNTYMMLNQPKEALMYFQKWNERSESLSLFAVLGPHRIGWAYWHNGYKKEAEFFFDMQINRSKKVIEMGRVLALSYRESYDLAAVYAFKGDKDRAIENLRNFNKLQMIPAWMMNYIKYDPLLDGIRDEPEFQQILRDVEAKYQAEHERVGKWLEEQDML
jgi:TolB-like protein